MGESSPKRRRFIDLKFRRGLVRHYFLQSLLAMAVIAIILAIFFRLGRLIFAAAMGSSAFVVFAAPSSVSAQPRCLLGGHYFSLLIGGLIQLLLWAAPLQSLGLDGDYARVLAAGLAVGLSIFVMAVTDTEHPPAAGTAMGSVLNEWSSAAGITVVVGTLVLSITRYLLRNSLRDLT